MKRLIVITVISAIFIVGNSLFFPQQGLAYQGGLLQGLMPSSVTGTATNTVRLTDNNITTISDVGQYTSIKYTLAQASTIDRVYINVLSWGSSTVKFYNSSNALISTFIIDSLGNGTTTLSRGDHTTLGSVINDVKYFEYNTEISVPGIRELDIYAPDSTPPANVTNLVKAAGTVNSILISWTAIPATPDFREYRVYKDNVFMQATANLSYQATGLIASTSYNLKVTSMDWRGNESTGTSGIFSTNAPPDTTPPAIPTGLSASNGDNAHSILNWNANSEPDIKDYRIYRNTSLIATVTHPITTYTATGLTNGVQYNFTITSRDTVNNESLKSSIVSATPAEPPDVPPAAPVGLSVTGEAGGAAISWTANTEPDLAGYNLYRDGVKINGALITDTSYNDTGLVNGTEYSYTVTAVDTMNNESAASTIATATPQATVPGNVNVQSGSMRIFISWSSVVNATAYNVYKDGSLLATVTETQLVDEDVVNGQTYSYTVTAIINGIEGDPSGEQLETAGQVIEFPDSADGLPGIIAVVLSAFSFAGLFAPYIVLILCLMLVAVFISFIRWLFTPPKQPPKKEGKEKTAAQRKTRTPLTAEEKERRNHERKLWKARIDKYELLTRQGRVSERDQWIKEAKIEQISTKIQAKERRRQRAATTTETKSREQRSGRTGRSGRDGRK